MNNAAKTFINQPYADGWANHTLR